MITNLHVNTRTGEVAGITNEILLLYGKHPLSSDAQLANIIALIKAENARLSSNLNKSIINSNLKEKNQARGNALIALQKFLMGNSYALSPEVKTAAQNILDVFQQYGLSIQRESYAIESAMIQSLLMDLSKETLAPSIATIDGCKELIEALAVQQEAFQQAELFYQTAKATRPEPASNIRLNLIRLINHDLLRYLKAMQTLQQSDYEPFTNAVMEVIRDQNRIVKKRSKKRAQQNNKEQQAQ